MLKNKNIFLIFLIIVVIALVGVGKFLGTKKVNQSPISQTTKENQNPKVATTTATTNSSMSVNSSSKTTQSQSQTYTLSSQVTTSPPKIVSQPVCQDLSQAVCLKINIGSSNYTYKVSWTAGMSVYDVMVKANAEDSISMVGKNYGAPLNSYYLTGLEGNNCSCWVYKLNGVDPGLGVSAVKVSAGDTVSWSTI